MNTAPNNTPQLEIVYLNGGLDHTPTKADLQLPVPFPHFRRTCTRCTTAALLNRITIARQQVWHMLQC